MIVFEAIIDGVRSLKDGSLKISLETQEMEPTKLAEFFSFKGLSKVLISQDYIEQKLADAVAMTPLQADTEKYSPSQKMRFALKGLFERYPDGFTEFEDFYRHRMKALIDKINQTHI